MLKKIVSLVISIVLVLGIFAACSSSETPAESVSESASSESQPSEAATDESEASSSDGFVIAFCDNNMTETWRVQMHAEFDQRAQELQSEGVISEYYVTVADGDSSKQISDIRDMITRGVDGIIVAVTTPSSISPVIEEAMDAGIAVVNFNALADTDNVTSKVYQSDVEFGRVQAEWLVDKLNGKGNIIVLNGLAGNSVNNARWSGAEEVFSQYPDIKVLGSAYAGWDYTEGKAAVESMLSAYPEIDGVWSQGGAMTQGAIDAFIANSRPLVPMTGEAGNGFLRTWKKYMGVDNFDSMAPNYTATISVTALNTLIDALQGEDVEKDIVIPMGVVSADNIDDYYREDLPDSFWVDTQLTEENLNKLFEAQ